MTAKKFCVTRSLSDDEKMKVISYPNMSEGIGVWLYTLMALI